MIIISVCIRMCLLTYEQELQLDVSYVISYSLKMELVNFQ